MNRMAAKDITFAQFVLMIHGAQLGIGILSLPARLGEAAGTDGWISLLVGWAVACLAGTLIILAMRRHPEDTLYDLIPRYFGRPVGYIVQLAVVGYFFYAFFVCLTFSVGMIQVQVLVKTPMTLLTLLVAMPALTIVRKKVRVFASFTEMTFWGFIWLAIVYMVPLRDAHWLNALPLLKEGWLPVLRASRTTVLSFLGFETAFILYPYLKDKQRAITGVILGNALTLAVYLIIVGVCFLYFSPDDLASYRYPTLKMLKTIEFRFLDRVDIVLLVSYLIMMTKVWMSYLFCASSGAARLLRHRDHERALLGALACAVLLTIWVQPSFDEMDRLTEWFGKLGLGIAYLFPPVLAAYSAFYRRYAKVT